MKLITTQETDRRIVDTSYDTKPSTHHIFNYKFCKKYIKNKVVLDIGCWSGQFEQLASAQVKKIIGIDPSSEAILLARGLVPHAEFKAGTLDTLPFKQKSFDCVTMLEVIEHLPPRSEARTIRMIRSLLKVNGYLVLSTPNNHPASILLDPAYFLINHRHYSMNYLKKLLTTNGFRIVKTKQTGGIITLSSHLIELMIKHVLKKSFKKPKWVLSAIDREYQLHGFAENHIIAQKITSLRYE